MKDNFWKKLPKPFFVLAPMANVTDAAFRRVIAKYSKWGGRDLAEVKESLPASLPVGGPDVTWTEFVSADGLIRATPEGKAKLLKDLVYDESERPIVAQLFSGKPEYMEEAARLCESLGFDGIDINMGCPDKTIEKQRSGACLIKYPDLAREIIRAAKRGAPSLPISVKTRIGYNKVELEEWLPVLLSEDIAALTVHARTRKEMSKVPARWEHVARAVEIRNEMKKDTLIIGNGDVKSLEEGEARVKETGCDGVMIGRGIFGNPFLFANLARVRRGCQIEHPSSILPQDAFGTQNKNQVKVENEAQSPNRAECNEYASVNQSCKIEDGIDYKPTLKEQLTALLEHIELFDQLLGTTKNFMLMKKHFKSYVQNFENASDLREKLMNAEGKEEAVKILKEFLQSY